jgi:NitT/TauT family transport system substrate-binding protein
VLELPIVDLKLTDGSDIGRNTHTEREVGLMVLPSRFRRYTGFILGLCFVLAAPASTNAQTPAPLIRVGAGPDDTSVPLIYADKMGLFKKAGLNVELVKLAGSAVITAALAGGSLEIAKVSSSVAVTAHVKGLPFTAVGAISAYSSEHPDFALIVAANSPIKSVKDLPGKTLTAISLQDFQVLGTQVWAAQNGVDPASMKFIEMPATSTLNALEQGRVDAAPVAEPILSASMASGKFRIIGYPIDAIAKHFTGGLLLSNASWADSHRDVIDRFLHVAADASAYVASHENDMAPFLAEYMNVEPGSIPKTRHAVRGVAIVPADLQPVIDALVKFKAIQKPFPAAEMICSCALRH